MTYIDFVSKLSPIEEEVMKSSFYEVSERIVNFAETQFFVFWFFMVSFRTVMALVGLSLS